ncbi:4-oxalomesaconate tautomerase [Arenibaculum sp.]|uniref:4-oxalomesaconate tautomerase n=1 Tax=Arenibaculum sp. TaxID=2865862 RepID=UPI002E0D5666|nr:4-oxalomesaconate tautomerase [Arenibaculum sp.]
MMVPIPCVLMRGGTSRGPLLLADDLPVDPRLRDETLMAIMGAGHELQVDGIGGGHPLTSKVGIVGPSRRADADVDYLFAQVSVRSRLVDTEANCGNMLAAVGPFAIETGLVPADSPETSVLIHNVNTGKLVEAVVQTPGGVVTYEGGTSIDGVPGTAAPVRLGFLDAAGSKTGSLLPTGNPIDLVAGVRVSCVDMAIPMVFIDAADLGKRGHETPAELDADTAFLARLEAVRREAGALMGLGDVSGKVIPKPALVAPPRLGGTVASRYFMPHACHRAYAATGAVCLATACVLPGTLPNGVCADAQPGSRVVTVEHPTGSIQVEIAAEPFGGGVTVRRASLLRTARRLLDGRVYVPWDVLHRVPEAVS